MTNQISLLLLAVFQVLTLIGGIEKTPEIALDPIAAEDIYETSDSVVLSMDSLRITEKVTPEDISRTIGYIEKTKKAR